MTESVTYVLETNNKIYEESEDVWEKMRTLQILITTMLVALLFINIFTFNVSYVRAESATTDISNSATADVSIDYEKIQEEFEQINLYDKNMDFNIFRYCSWRCCTRYTDTINIQINEFYS